jgi:hypothetical protein
MKKENAGFGQEPEKGRIVFINRDKDPNNCPARSPSDFYSAKQPGGPPRNVGKFGQVLFLGGKKDKNNYS